MWEKELAVALEAAEEARKIIMDIYHTQFAVEIKEDDSPVTMADQMADQLIREHIKKRFPSHAFLTEESVDDLSRRSNDYCWIVDPVDGTKDFIAKNDEFTTNIALAYKGEIVVGVVSIPAKNEVYCASQNNGSYYLANGKIIRNCVNDKTSDLLILTSRFHVNALELDFIEAHKDYITKRETVGSALKMCYIARGLAELTVRFSSGTKEWDIAASCLVVTEAGGCFTKPDGSPITFNREDVYNREGYVVCNRPENNLFKKEC